MKMTVKEAISKSRDGYLYIGITPYSISDDVAFSAEDLAVELDVHVVENPNSWDAENFRKVSKFADGVLGGCQVAIFLK